MSTPRFGSLLLSSLLLLGCASEEVEVSVPDGPVETPAELTVIVWSDHLKAPVAAEGRITAVDGNDERAFSTKADAARGHSVSLPAGRYRIVVTHRFADATKKSVDGGEVLYLEPGARRGLTVVATDQKSKDIGFLPRGEAQLSPLATTPPLPLESSSG